MNPPERDLNRTARPEVLAIIRRWLTSPGIKSAHYGGYAQEPVLRLLKEHLGRGFAALCSAGR